MRRAVIALLSFTVLGLLNSSLSDGGTDWLAGTDEKTVVVSGTQTATAPKNQRDINVVRDDDSPARTDAAPPPSPPCKATMGRTTTCGLDAVRVTNEGGTPLTITDVASFAPPPVTVTAEPNDAGVAGAASNFVASASVQTESGDLFGRRVTVRFTPVGYDFVHGDGTTTSTTDPGKTWAALGQAPFTPTPTSHAYRERGTYQAHVTVRYTAEVDLGSGWFPVTGELSIVGADQLIRIFEARTALVAFTCDQRPVAPGC